ncbi:MAG: Holliday junction resolvase RuvX [Roseibacillus sp.]
MAAHPVETIEVARADPLERIAEVVREREVKLMLLGLPLRLDGSEGDAAQRVRSFGDDLAEKIPGIPLQYADERLSTTAASEKLRAAGVSARKQKDLIDQAAALEILNDWLAEQ